MESYVCIYALVDPRTDEIRYVGQSVNPSMRLEQHLGSKHGSKAKTRWLENLYRARQVPVMMVLDWVPSDQADDYEKVWIKTLLADGAPLTNVVHNVYGVKYTPSRMGRVPVVTGRVYQYLDQILQTENRVASFSEVQQTLGIAKSTASKIRLQWMDERGLSGVENANGGSQD